jgi:hypothetical protein
MIVDLDAGHDVLVPVPPAGIAVHQFDQLRDGAPAVAHDMGRHALGHRHHLPVDYQEAVVVTGVELLHDHAAAVRRGQFEAAPDLVLRLEIDADAPPVVAVQRLDHHREAHARGLGHRLVGGADHHAPRHGQARFRQQQLGQVLAARGLHGDLGGPAGDARPDALLTLAVTQLNQALVAEAHHRDVPLDGFFHQGAGGGAVAATAPHALQIAHGGVEVEAAVQRTPGVPFIEQDIQAPHTLQLGRQERVDELKRQPPGVEARQLLLIGVHDVVDARLAPYGAGLAGLDPKPGQVLQL